MGLFDYLNIADGGEDDSFSLDNDNNIDFGKLFKEKGVFGALDGINKNRENAYKDEVARTKLERGKSFFGSLATLGGQMIASGMGARQFNPIKDQTPQYNERLQRLRDAKRAEDAQTNNKSLSMVVRELDQKRADEWQNRQREDAANRDANKQQWDKYKFDTNLEETIRHNKEMEKASITRALRPAGSSSSSSQSKVIDSVMGSDGNIYTRNSRLTPNEIRQIVLGSGISQEDLAPFVVVEKDYLGNVIKSRTDYDAAFAYLSQNGMISGETWIDMGFNTSNKPKAPLKKDGWSLKE